MCLAALIGLCCAMRHLHLLVPGLMMMLPAPLFSTAMSLSAGRLTVTRIGEVVSKLRLKPKYKVLFTTATRRAASTAWSKDVDNKYALLSPLGLISRLNGRHDVMLLNGATLNSPGAEAACDASAAPGGLCCAAALPRASSTSARINRLIMPDVSVP